LHFRLIFGVLDGRLGGEVFAHLNELPEETVVLALQAGFEAGEVVGAITVGIERGAGEAHEVWGGDFVEFSLNGGRHAVDLDVDEGGLGGGDAEGAPEGVSHLEDEGGFELVLGLETVEVVLNEAVEGFGVFSGEEDFL